MCKVTSLSVSSWVWLAQQRGEVSVQSRMKGCMWSRGRTWRRCCARSRCTDRARGCRRCRRTCWSSSPRTAPQWWTPGPGGDSLESCTQSPGRLGAEASVWVPPLSPDPDAGPGHCGHCWQPLCPRWWQLASVWSGGNSQWSAGAGWRTRRSRRC